MDEPLLYGMAYNQHMSEQHWDPTVYLRDAAFVPALGVPVLELLAPRAGEHILDLGCGDGTLTAQLRAAGTEVLGVDSSPEQIAAARARGLKAEVMDAHALPFTEEFDAVFSNAALHWMLEPAAVLAGVRRALKIGGRFVGEMGGAGNVASVVAAYGGELAARALDVRQYNPWFFPTVTEYTRLLESAGFIVDSIDLFARPTALPGDVREWLTLMTQPFLSAVAPAAQAELVDAVRTRIRGQAQQADGRWELDYVRLRFQARKV